MGDLPPMAPIRSVDLRGKLDSDQITGSSQSQPHSPSGVISQVASGVALAGSLGASSWIEIDQAALAHNLNYLKKLVGPQVKLAVVAKSNAYGCGLVPIAQLCQYNINVAYLCVFSVAEALTVRAQGFTKPILVLGFHGWDPVALARALQQQIDLTVYDVAQLEQLEALAQQLGQRARLQIKVDTGLARLGFTPAVVRELYLTAQFQRQFPHLQITGIYTHLAISEQPDAPFSQHQLTQLSALVAAAKAQNYDLGLVHAAGSACAFLTNAANFDLVRLGGMTYGLSKFPNPNLKFILRWCTRVIQLKQLPAQVAVGYGQTFVTTRPTRLAVVPVGYTDGYDRRLSNRGQVLVNGVLAPVVGRVAMNMLTIDVTAVPEVAVGTVVTLLGATAGITPADWSAAAGSYIYETTVQLNPNIPRLLS